MQGPTANITRTAWVCAAALTVFVVWLTTPTESNVGIGFFYTVPIGLAAWWGGWRYAVLAIAGCAGLLLVGDAAQPVEEFGVVLAVRLTIFAAVAALAIALRARIEVLEHSAEELEDIRAALTPTRPIDLPEVDAGAAFVPSDHGVSGDFFLITNGPDGSIVAIVGDVVGHGPEAARLATFIRARLGAFAANTSDPAELLALANGALIDRPGPATELVSATCLRYDAGSSELSWAVAGHPPPLKLPRLENLQPPGATLLLGARPGLRLRTARSPFGAGDGVLVYTDGATDVRREGGLLGLEGLRRLVKPLSLQSARAMAKGAEEAILGWTDEPLRDDLCLLVVKPRVSA